ncbi:DUF4132 domain-containing protein [Actibacterium lipolyticum]|uniref:Uncharacterized protein n=1 Tax=Actibacterium lipolyticum TaxID=1524263 RepID=A0A238L8E9_9RHOB|nr:DUF4132 domain-containing protein [Actibacterium lipolyticum]SMX51288.1 hypothetical protein COL8621_03819 [Actibacterium lipolyticum]
MVLQPKADAGIGYDDDFFPQRDGNLTAKIETFLEKAQQELNDQSARPDWGKCHVVKALKSSDNKFSTDVACYCFDHICRQFYEVTPDTRSGERTYLKYAPLLKVLARKPLVLDVPVLVTWMRYMLDITERSKSVSTSPQKVKGFADHANWPLASLIQIILKRAKKHPLSSDEIEQVRSMLDWEPFQPSYVWFDASTLSKRINEILATAEQDVITAPPYKALGGDNFGIAVEAKLNALPVAKSQEWHKVLHLAASVVGSRPTKKFHASVEALKAELGKEKLRAILHEIVRFALDAKLYQTPWMLEHEVIFTKKNAELLKGITWVSMQYQDAKTINQIADLCEKSMKKIPGIGPAAQATANACLFYLEDTPGIEATARLSRLSTAIKQKSIQKKVSAIVAKKAEAAGITTIQLEERVVPSYGLNNGEKIIAFDDYTLKVNVDGPGQVSLTWLKPDGSPQKSKPKFVLDNAAHKARFDKVRSEASSLKKVLTAQRDRIDRLFAEDVEWPLHEIEEYYVQHGLIGVIAAKLVWVLRTEGKAIAAVWHDDTWQDLNGAPVETTEQTTVRLWHPIDWETEVVMAWRARMAALEIVQPTKQVYREVYLLTDAERSTNTYSNRMAAHMLKQHQMATLMAARGWHYSLMGAYDDGIDSQWASKNFVTTDLSARYLLHTNWDDENWNDAGIYLYVGTDQLCFVRNEEPVALETVPLRVFSETMREADLFAGVASVGNDPLWVDQGPTPEARTYWQSYSFGDLDGFANTRKQVLEDVLPRLKICDLAHIEGNFLIVDGKLNTYKIHLGSSNILMQPGDRYLCIVPASGSQSSKVALPFEGDNRLSVILSKAIMLAEDDKITAQDIVRQLRAPSEG